MNAFSRAALTRPRVSQDWIPGMVRAVSLETGRKSGCPRGGFLGPCLQHCGAGSLETRLSRSFVCTACHLPELSLLCDLLTHMAQPPVSSSRSGLSLVSASAAGCRPGSRLSLAAGWSAAVAVGDHRPAGAPALGLGLVQSALPPPSDHGSSCLSFPSFSRETSGRAPLVIAWNI